VPVSTANTPARRPAEVWVTSRIRRLSLRSAYRPPAWPKIRIGRKRAAVVSPSCVPLCVRSSTRNDWAIVCIQVPITEISWPKKNSR
jgi:hypothetical protein